MKIFYLGGCMGETKGLGYDMSIDAYKTILNILHEEHIDYCENWLTMTQEELNLKKILVGDIFKDEVEFEYSFNTYMHDFMKSLTDLQLSVIQRVESETGIWIGTRIKSTSKIIDKLQKKSKQDRGKFPINRCLNDLLGFRIVDNHYDINLGCVIKYIEALKNKKYRIRNINRDLNAYKGYHIYFNGKDNKVFPIELQIWDSKYEHSNRESHKVYKQDYKKEIEKYYDI